MQTERLPYKSSKNFHNKTAFCRITIVYSESHTQPQNTICGKEVITVLERVKREMYAPTVHNFMCA
jgi:hypothetical protein